MLVMLFFIIIIIFNCILLFLWEGAKGWNHAFLRNRSLERPKEPTILIHLFMDNKEWQCTNIHNGAENNMQQSSLWLKWQISVYLCRGYCRGPFAPLMLYFWGPSQSSKAQIFFYPLMTAYNGINVTSKSAGLQSVNFEGPHAILRPLARGPAIF